MYKRPTKKEKHAENANKETSKSGESLQLEDGRTSSAVQRKVQHLMQNYVPKNVIQQKKNTTGIPDKLKSGIENLSGVSLNDVKVHYNSSKPAQLNAHAYAKGNTIHVASGQEKHLPHEAWHVVQQKQGRVKPTIQTKENIAINDDAHLEREADIMGEKALQLKTDDSNANSTHTEATSEVIQPRVITYHSKYKGPLTNKYQKQVVIVVNQIDQKVQNAYKQSLQWQTLSNYNDKMVSNWYKMAKDYVSDPRGKKPKLLYARFGYSIESIACAGLNNKDVGGGLTAKTQVSHGHTRPDIVLVDSQQTEVAWIDITSEGSIGHIDGKDGAGWANRPFICEVVYPKLQLNTLVKATKDPYYQQLGGLIADENQIELDTKLQNINAIRREFIKLRDKHDWTTGTGNASTKKKTTRDFFMSEAANEGVEDEKHSIKNTKGALEYVGINSGPYGFNRGSKKTSNERIKQVIDEKSKNEIQQKQRQMRRSVSIKILKQIENKISVGLRDKFFEQIHSNPGDRDTTLALMAMKAALMDNDFQKLSNALDDLQAKTDISDNRVGLLEKEIKRLMDGPKGADHDAIMNWRKNVTNRVNDANTLIKIHKVRKELIMYANKQGWTFFNRPKQLTKWLQELGASPPNAQVANQIELWLKDPKPIK